LGAVDKAWEGAVDKAWKNVSSSFDRCCLAAGIETRSTMLENDAEQACGPRHSRGEGRREYRWGRTQGKIAFHGGKVEIERPRVPGQERAAERVGNRSFAEGAKNLVLKRVNQLKACF
jgi:hypothetical protein